MDKTKLLTFAVISLLILNFGVLGFLVFSKKEHGPRGIRPMPKEIIIEKLGFDALQIAEYDKLIKIHRQSIRSTDDSIRETKNELYELLNSDSDVKIQKDSLISKIAFYQKQIEVTNFNHFLDIKKLCSKDQITKFHDLTLDLTRIFSKKNKNHND
ncbi:MAG: hypothetical protein H7174_13600 [Flavobacterium sp.]|nr:hypothetical protein [Flavobacterium sp.]